MSWAINTKEDVIIELRDKALIAHRTKPGNLHKDQFINLGTATNENIDFIIHCLNQLKETLNY